MGIWTNEGVYLARTSSLCTLCAGCVSLIPETAAEPYVLLLRPPFLLFLYQTDSLKLLSDSKKNMLNDESNVEVHIITLIDTTVENFQMASTFIDESTERNSTSAIRMMRNGKPLVAFIPIDIQTDVWLGLLRFACSVLSTTWKRDMMRAQLRDGKPNYPRYTGYAASEIFSTQQAIENVLEQNEKLRIALSSASMASAEIAEQKNMQLLRIQRKMKESHQESLAAYEKLTQLTAQLNEKNALLSVTEKNLAKERTRCERIKDLLYTEKRLSSAEYVLQLQSKQDRIEELLIENYRLRWAIHIVMYSINDAIHSSKYLDNLRDTFIEQIKCLKSAAEAADVVELVRLKYKLSMLIISVFRRCVGGGLAAEERIQVAMQIKELQSAVRLAETCAQSQYIHFRAKLLEYRLNRLVGYTTSPELVDCLLTILKRYSWVLQSQPITSLFTKDTDVNQCHICFSQESLKTGAIQCHHPLPLPTTDEDILMLPPYLLFSNEYLYHEETLGSRCDSVGNDVQCAAFERKGCSVL